MLVRMIILLLSLTIAIPVVNCDKSGAPGAADDFNEGQELSANIPTTNSGSKAQDVRVASAFLIYGISDLGTNLFMSQVESENQNSSFMPDSKDCKIAGLPYDDVKCIETDSCSTEVQNLIKNKTTVECETPAKTESMPNIKLEANFKTSTIMTFKCRIGDIIFEDDPNQPGEKIGSCPGQAGGDDFFPFSTMQVTISSTDKPVSLEIVKGGSEDAGFFIFEEKNYIMSFITQNFNIEESGNLILDTSFKINSNGEPETIMENISTDIKIKVTGLTEDFSYGYAPADINSSNYDKTVEPVSILTTVDSIAVDKGTLSFTKVELKPDPGHHSKVHFTIAADKPLKVVVGDATYLCGGELDVIDESVSGPRFFCAEQEKEETE